MLWGILTGQGLWAQARLKVTLDPLRSTVPAAFPLLGPTSGGRVTYPSFCPTLIHTGREEHSPLPKLMPYVES